MFGRNLKPGIWQFAGLILKCRWKSVDENALIQFSDHLQDVIPFPSNSWSCRIEKKRRFRGSRSANCPTNPICMSKLKIKIWWSTFRFWGTRFPEKKGLLLKTWSILCFDVVSGWGYPYQTGDTPLNLLVNHRKNPWLFTTYGSGDALEVGSNWLPTPLEYVEVFVAYPPRKWTWKKRNISAGIFRWLFPPHFPLNSLNRHICWRHSHDKIWSLHFQKGELTYVAMLMANLRYPAKNDKFLARERR